LDVAKEKKEKLSLLKGFNPDGVEGVVLRPTADMEVYVVPDRGLEVLDVLVAGRPVMYRNLAGHLGRCSYQRAGLGPLAHIEGAFTAGPDNVGGGTDACPLHGTFSVTPAADVQRTASGGVRGSMNCSKLVVGPNIIVERTVEPVEGRRAFRIIDEISATVTSDYMWLYHPNFPVATGTRFVSSETVVVPRPGDAISGLGAENYRLFERVGEGRIHFPRTDGDPAAIAEENFEKCYVMQVKPDAAGLVRAALVAPDGTSAAYVKYAIGNFAKLQQAFQFWKNPRDGVSGLEFGSTFLGWAYAAKHGMLGCVKKGETHRYECEIGFLTTRAKVEAFTKEIPAVGPAEIRRLDTAGLAEVYRTKV
jgi:hypothetical protein